MSHLISTYRGLWGGDPVFRVSEAARQRRAVTPSVIDASLGVLTDDQGRLAQLPAVTCALREVPAETWAEYAPILGTPEFLRAATKEAMAMFPEPRPPSVAVASPGGTGALRLAVNTLLEPGQKALTVAPYWGPYATLTREAGRGLTSVPITDALGHFALGSFERAVHDQMHQQGRVTVILNDPCHNPTGFSMTEADWRGVAEILRQAAAQGPVALVLDLAYSAYAVEPLAPIGRILAELSRSVLLALAWSASKTLLHYGLRVGALVVLPPRGEEQADWNAALGYACRGMWSNCNHGGMVAVTRALLDPAVRARVLQERETYEALLKQRGTLWNDAVGSLHVPTWPYRGGFFVTLPCHQAEQRAEFLQQKDIFVLPLAEGIRVALCSVPTPQVQPLAAAIADALKRSV